MQNWLIRQDSNIYNVVEAIRRFATMYKERLEIHLNQLAEDLLSANAVRRLKKPAL